MFYFKPIVTPVGELKLVASDSGLAGILWENDDPKRTRFLPQTRDDDHPILIETERQLSEYFTGARRCFELPLDFVGTEFQKKSGRRWWRSRLVRRAATARLRGRSAIRWRCEPSGRPMGVIRSRLSHRATA